MAEMAELCELYEECSDLQMDVLSDEGDLPQMEVGGGGREAALSGAGSGAAPPLEEEGPMEEEEGGQPMAAPRGRAGLACEPSPGPQQSPGLEGEAEELDDWEDDSDYPEAEAEELDDWEDDSDYPEAEAEELDDWNDDYDYPEEELLNGAGYRVPATPEEADKMFLRLSLAREAALEVGFQMQYEKTPYEQLAFIEELFTLRVINRLAEELGCDEMIDTE